MKKNILFIVPAEYEALKEKGVADMIYERDEGGFFGRIITVHPFCDETRVISLNDRFIIYEVGFDFFPWLKTSRWAKILQVPIHFFRVIITIFAAMKRHNVSIIRANDPFWMAFFARITAVISGVPYCVSVHADYDKMKQFNQASLSMAKLLGSYRLGRWLEKSAYQGAVSILPIREYLGRKAIEHGADEEKIHVIPHGVKLSSFQGPAVFDVEKIFGLAEDKMVLSFVGRLSKENYIDDIVLMARRLGALRDDFIIVVAGGGKEEKRIKEMIQGDPVLSETVKLVGFQPREVCLELRRRSLASLCLMGGFSLIEACAAGSPVIAYDVEWHAEMVNNKLTGFLVPEGNIEMLVDAVCRLLDNPLQAKKMGAIAKKKAFSRHNLKATSEIKIQAYKKVLGE